MFKGWKTLVYGLGVAILPAALDYAAGVPWEALGVHPAIAAMIGAGIVGLRMVTTSPPLRR